VIGGRVLDASALVGFASGTSVYAQALVWTAVEEGLALVVPSTAVAAAFAGVAEKDLEILDVLLTLPVTVVDELTTARARVVGQLGGADQLAAHVVACARDRAWPLVTAAAERYVEFSGLVEVEQLPPALRAGAARAPGRRPAPRSAAARRP
jgi:hypothetical protein